jgi:hypothetical protein
MSERIGGRKVKEKGENVKWRSRDFIRTEK